MNEWLNFINGLREGDQGTGDGGGGTSGSSSDVEFSFKNRLAKYEQDANALARDLFRDNYQAREKIRDLENEQKELKSKLPAKDSVVLTKEEAQAFNNFKELGKSVEDVKVALDSQGELVKLRREKVYREAAQALDWNVKALSDLLDGKEVKVEGEGDNRKILLSVGEDKTQDLKEWVEKEKAHFLPSLSTQSDDTGTPFGAGGNKQPKGNDLVGNFLKQRNEAETSAKSPLE